MIQSGLELFKPETTAVVPERVIIYGRAGVGKTRLALELPDTDKWGEVLYYAADDNSEWLRSVRPTARKRIHVIKPRGSRHQENFQQFCMQDWKNLLDPTTKKPLPADKQPYLNVRTLVVDTFTTVAFKTIQQIANDGTISREEHFIIGDIKNGGFAIPSRSDYQGIDFAVKGFMDMLTDKQRDYNVILLCHEDSKEVSKGIMRGGPSVPGRRLLEDLPATFNTVIRLIREPMLVQPANVVQNKVVALTGNDGLYVSKLRESDYSDEQHPLGKVILDQNPVNFWNQFDAYMSKKEQQ